MDRFLSSTPLFPELEVIIAFLAGWNVELGCYVHRLMTEFLTVTLLNSDLRKSPNSLTVIRLPLQTVDQCGYARFWNAKSWSAGLALAAGH
ncbi:hypothetical protein SUGI_0565060 [Cryptomeria japonica]|nr:hypothetical protein SUGI_0565060 [Cryptomeria japonica]